MKSTSQCLDNGCSNHERLYCSPFGSLVSRKRGMKITTLTEHEDRRIDDLASRRGELLAAIIFLIFVIERNWIRGETPRVKYPRLDRKGIPTERESRFGRRSRRLETCRVILPPRSKEAKRKREREIEKEESARGMSRKGLEQASVAISCESNGSRLEARGSAQRRIKHTYTMYTLLVKPKRKKKKKKREKNREAASERDIESDRNRKRVGKRRRRRGEEEIDIEHTLRYTHKRRKR